MTNKVYRTAQGQLIDMGALALKNEQVKAVGNMGVNSRGDIVDANGKTVSSANQRVNKQYQKQTNVHETPITKAKSAPASELVADSAPEPVVEEVVNVVEETVVFPEDYDEEVVVKEEEPVKKTGLAGALAKAKKD